jgi:tetratricopeptide (TPR) repeat protein
VLTLLLARYRFALQSDQDLQKNYCLESIYYQVLILVKSASSLDQAIDLCPQVPIAYHLRATRYSIDGNHDRTIGDFNEEIRLEDHPFFAFVRLADEYFEKESYDDAVRDYTEAVNQSESLEKALKDRDFLQQGRERLQRSIPYLFYKRAKSQFHKARYEPAVEDYTDDRTL